MNALDVHTPGLLFPAVSLLMLAYTNRFLGLASLARELIAEYHTRPDPARRTQVENLCRRIGIVRHVQGVGVSSLFCCTASIFAVFIDRQGFAQWSFVIALLLMLASLGMALLEIHLSVRALHVEVATLDSHKP